MEVHEIILSRRSIRRYTPEEVSDRQVLALLQAAMAAPSADNLKPWEFVVVRDPERRRALAGVHTWASMAAEAPVVFVVCGDEGASGSWIEDASAATENLLLQAAAMGLGSVWVGIYPGGAEERHVRQTLGIPEHLRVLCLVPVGYPAEHKPPRTQYEERKVHYERYGRRNRE